MALFTYDTLLAENDFCNFNRERKALEHWIENGKCVKIYGQRNFGKTSLVRNIVGKNWERKDPDKRLVLFVDFFSVETEKDVATALHKAFSGALSQKQNWIEKGASFFSLFKSIRPTWKPPVSPDDLGEFSITTETGTDELTVETVFENIEQLTKKGKYQCLIILDEFQELAELKAVQAKIRGALQKLNDQTPVAILGSKSHMLRKIFEHPNMPFHSWGNTIEMGFIPIDEYTKYANERLALVNKKLLPEASECLQNFLFRIPEPMNRACDFIASSKVTGNISLAKVTALLREFIEMSKSVPASQYTVLSQGERAFLKVLSESAPQDTVHSKAFVIKAMQRNLSKSSLAGIKNRLMDKGVVCEEFKETKSTIRFADPLLYQLVKNL
jgi:ATPase domain predominantly from Archaea